MAEDNANVAVEENQEETKAKPSKAKKVKVQFLKTAEVNGIVRMIGSVSELKKSEAEDLKEIVKVIN